MVVLQKSTFTQCNTATENCWRDLLLQLRYGEYCENNILGAAEKRLISEILLDICEDCAKMAALPQGAFAACKLRENFRDRDMIIARMKSGGDKTDAKNMSANKKLMEYSPVKYNGKLMNSIWGLYNRYSPHNIKGNDYEADKQGYTMQQPAAVASSTIAKNLTNKAMESSGNEWRFWEK